MIILDLSVIIFIIYLLIQSTKKRVPPNNSSKFILSPIDGTIENIQTINLDNIIFIEIQIKFNLNSSRNLFAPIKGNITITENLEEKVTIIANKKDDEKNTKDCIEIIHYPNVFLTTLNFLSSKFITIDETEIWNTSKKYGSMLTGKSVKILIHGSNEITASIGQSLIGGESILAIITETETI